MTATTCCHCHLQLIVTFPFLPLSHQLLSTATTIACCCWLIVTLSFFMLPVVGHWPFAEANSY